MQSSIETKIWGWEKKTLPVSSEQTKSLKVYEKAQAIQNALKKHGAFFYNDHIRDNTEMFPIKAIVLTMVGKYAEWKEPEAPKTEEKSFLEYFGDALVKIPLFEYNCWFSIAQPDCYTQGKNPIEIDEDGNIHQSVMARGSTYSHSKMKEMKNGGFLFQENGFFGNPLDISIMIHPQHFLEMDFST